MENMMGMRDRRSKKRTVLLRADCSVALLPSDEDDEEEEEDDDLDFLLERDEAAGKMGLSSNRMSSVSAMFF
jgi:hypothetical protein